MRMISTHPPYALLAAYAAGEAGYGQSLAVAGHLTYCAECRAKVAEIEELQAAFMACSPEAEPLSAEALLARLDEEEEPARAAPASGPLPAPVAEAVGVDFDKIPWRFRLPGVHEHIIHQRKGERVSLFRAKPGCAFPQHTHGDQELTIVFQGQLDDETTELKAGDLCVATDHVDHKPRAGGDETCICLIVVCGGLTFTGRFGKLMRPFAGRRRQKQRRAA